MIQSFSKIWIIGILAVVLAGGFLTWQYWAPKPAPADETADWQTYRNEEYGFELKYPQDWKVAQNIFRFEPNLVFCPFSLTDSDSEVVCKLKIGATKPQYEEGMIYLFTYNSDPKPNNSKYHYLGSASEKYYYLYSDNNESIINQILSTFLLFH